MFGLFIKSWLLSTKGNVGMIFALSAIPLLGATTGVLEIGSLMRDRQVLQSAADAGALAAATRLTMISDTSGRTGAADFAVSTAQQVIATSTRSLLQTTFRAEVDSTHQSVTVYGQADHKALLGFMGFGDRIVNAEATASTLVSVPLCILQTGTGNKGGAAGPPESPPPAGTSAPAGPAGQPGGPELKGGLSLNDSSRIRATGCAVHANQNIKVGGSAMLQASRTQAVGAISGAISPTGFSGSMPIEDPFASMDLKAPTVCEGKPEKVEQKTAGTVYLAPGVHCEHFKIEKDAVLFLQPGEHYFMDHLEAKDGATIEGDDVVLIFGDTKVINFADHAAVRLTARKTGSFAGFLIVTSRENHEKFVIASNKVSELLGTIYIPNAELDIETGGSVAQDSAWSIIVADRLVLRKSPSLVINSQYIGSGVPVPDGVGPGAGTAVLTH